MLKGLAPWLWPLAIEGSQRINRVWVHEGKLGRTKSRGQQPAPPTHHHPFKPGGDYSTLPAPFSRLRKQLVNGMRDGYVREGRGWDRARIATHLWLCAWGVRDPIPGPGRGEIAKFQVQRSAER
jgi:hypothetical protein